MDLRHVLISVLLLVVLISSAFGSDGRVRTRTPSKKGKIKNPYANRRPVTGSKSLTASQYEPAKATHYKSVGILRPPPTKGDKTQSLQNLRVSYYYADPPKNFPTKVDKASAIKTVLSRDPRIKKTIDGKKVKLVPRVPKLHEDIQDSANSDKAINHLGNKDKKFKDSSRLDFQGKTSDGRLNYQQQTNTQNTDNSESFGHVEADKGVAEHFPFLIASAMKDSITKGKTVHLVIHRADFKPKNAN